MNNQLKKGFIFTAIGVYSNFLLQIVINMVLSRLLSPEDYGVVAIMQVFVLFFAMLIEAGMGPAIIQNKSLTQEDNKVLFNFSTFFALILAVLFGLFGLVLSAIYNNSLYIRLTWIFSIAIFFNGLSIVPTALLNKAKNFKAVNFSKVFGNVCAGVVGVTSALLGAGVYALLYSSIVSSVMIFLCNRFFSKVTATRHFYLAPVKSIWEFSKNQFMFNLINYFARNSDNILIGKFLGAAPLAEYNKAYQLLMMPNTLFSGIVTPVLQPVLSEFQDDVAYVRETYYKIIHILALFGIPLSIFLSFSARPIIFFMFGNQWGEAVTPFQILALTVWIQMTLSSSGAIYQARNHSKLLLINGYLTGGILVLSIIIGLIFGNITSVAYSLSIGFVINFFIGFYMLNKYTLEAKMRLFFREFISPFFLGILMLLAMIIVGTFITPHINNSFIEVVVRGLIFIIVIFLYINFSSEKDNVKQILKLRK